MHELHKKTSNKVARNDVISYELMLETD